MESALASPRGFLPGPRPLWSAARGPTTLARVTTRLRFGSSLIDLATRELSDDGRLLALSPRVFDCLAYLVEHRERAVGRDELMAAVWGRADISDSQLAQVMLKARRAVGDSGEAQRVIRTVAGFGYHWIAAVEPVVEAAQATPATLETVATGARLRDAVAWRWPLLWSSLLLLAGLIALAAWRARDDAGTLFAFAGDVGSAAARARHRGARGRGRRLRRMVVVAPGCDGIRRGAIAGGRPSGCTERERGVGHARRGRFGDAVGLGAART